LFEGVFNADEKANNRDMTMCGLSQCAML